MTPTQVLNFVKARCREDGGCWIWLGCVQHCGTTPTVRIPGSRKTTGVRRMVLQALGVDLQGKLATNTCESPLCVAPEHLAAVSRKDLQKRTSDNLHLVTRVKRDRLILARRRERAKLSPAIVDLIKQSPMSTRQIAKFLGVHQCAVWEAISGRSWKPITAPASNPFSGMFLGQA